jgi:hypothetical protein
MFVIEIYPSQTNGYTCSTSRPRIAGEMSIYTSAFFTFNHFTRRKYNNVSRITTMRRTASIVAPTSDRLLIIASKLNMGGASFDDCYKKIFIN